MRNPRTSAFFISFLLVLSAAAGIYAQSAASVGLYQGSGAKGTPQEIALGIYAVKAGVMGAPEGKNTGYSVRVPAGMTVRFCENAGTGNQGGGTCEEFGEGVHDLRSMAEVNYIRVGKAVEPVPSAPAQPARPAEQVGVVVYAAPSLQGISQGFAPGMYRSFKGEFGKILDNRAMSAVVAKGFRVRFCVDEGMFYRGAGDCEEHEAGRIDTLRFANAISFIEVIDLSDKSPKDDSLPVVLYEDADQVGKLQGFDAGTFLARAGEFRKLGSAVPSSIRVKKGYKATVCSEEPAPTDTCEEFGAGKFNFKKKRAGVYLKVWKADQ